MIEVFMVYSGTAEDIAVAREVSEYLERQKESKPGDLNSSKRAGFHISVPPHEHTSEDWKRDIGRQIKNSDIVLLIQGASTGKSCNVRWEIEQALMMHKPVLICQVGELDCPNWLKMATICTPFGNWVKPAGLVSLLSDSAILKWLLSFPFIPLSVREEQLAQAYPVGKLDAIERQMIRLAKKQYDIYSPGAAKMWEEEPEDTRQKFFEQYKMYQQTSEELEDREQKMNEYYLSINLALLTLFGGIIGWPGIPLANKTIILAITAWAGWLFNDSWFHRIERL